MLAVAGTRPECLKLASPVRALRALRNVSVHLLGSGQHAGMLAETAAHIGLDIDEALPPMLGSTLTRNVATLRERIRGIAATRHFDVLLVQGDTTTAYAGALAGRDLGIGVAHVEAGLRSPSLRDPFPEEWFRRRISRIADIHFAPTTLAAGNLLAEGVYDGRVHVTGNTIIDLLRSAIDGSANRPLDFLPPCDQFAVLTLHRRSNQGVVTRAFCDSIAALLERQPRLGVVCPLHPNPAASDPIRERLSDHPRVALTPPLDYLHFVALLARARLAISDSGGLQEEVPYLGTPLLIARAGTERPEALSGGISQLLDSPDQLIAEAERILARPRPAGCGFDANAPYGDGWAGDRIARHIASTFSGRGISAPLDMPFPIPSLA